MPKQQRKELSFQAGEISPLYLGRSDTEVYDKGLSAARNMFVDKRGGIFRRRGLEHYGRTAGDDARIFTLQVNRQRFYTLLLTHQKLTIIAPGSNMLGNNLLTNGSFVNGGTGWNTDTNGNQSSVTFTQGLCQMVCSNQGGSFARVSQQATVTALPTDVHLVTIGQSTGQVLTIKIGTTDGGSEITTFTTSSNEFTGQFTPNNATYWVTVENNTNGTTADVTFVGTADVTVGTGVGFEQVAPWTEDQLKEVHIVEEPTGETLYFTHPNVPVQKLVYNFASDSFSTLAAVSFTNPPAVWAGANHPSTGTYFQGRLWLGGTPNERQTFWGSVSAAPEDFSLDDGSGTVTDSHALELTLQEYGRIEWMLGTKNLLIGTENGEHIVKSDAGVITPNDFNIEKQSAFGSNNMQSLQVGEKVFYMTPDGRRLRSMSYEWQEDNWLSHDLTFASEHITEGIGRYGAWAQNPGNVFQVVLRDGNVASLTYDRTGQTIGWTVMEFTGFKVLDIATALVDGLNTLVYVGQRVSGQVDIEYSGFRRQTQYLDSYISHYDPSGTDIVSGLDHLEGETVRPVVDGAVDPVQVVSGGQINLATKGNQIYVGMDYTSTITTLPPDVAQSQIRSWKKRWNKVWALLYESKQPIINGIRPPDRTPSTPMNTVEPDRSTHYRTSNLGWDDFGLITIEQDLPVAMNILAIYGEMDAEHV